jgi:hypothetical protein
LYFSLYTATKIRKNIKNTGFVALLFPYLEHTLHSFDALYKRVYFFFGIVQTKRGSASAFHAQSSHEWFGAMMTRANGYAEAVKQSAHVQMMDVGSVGCGA